MTYTKHGLLYVQIQGDCMPKVTIKEDNQGKYVRVDGKVVRPIESSRYNEGESVDAQTCSGTIIYGLGKDESCKRGEYKEAWFETGLTNESVDLNEDVAHEVEQGRRDLLDDYPVVYEDGKFSFTTVKKEHNRLVSEGNTKIREAFRVLLSNHDGDKPLLTEDDLNSLMDYDKFDENEDDNV